MPIYIGMYDSSCSKLRRAIFAVFSSYGIHRQNSIFECELNTEQKKQLIKRLQVLTQNKVVNISIIQIYPDHQYSQLFGAAKELASDDGLYIY